MSEPTRDNGSSPSMSRPLRALTRASFALGSLGLVLTMSIEVSSVLGRHLRMPLLGSIELVQSCVVVFASSALVMTTLEGGHASVRMLVERLSPTARTSVQRAACLLSAAFFATLALGSLLILRDLLGGGEATELLGLPILPLRVFWCVSALLIVALFVWSATARRPTGRT